MKFAEIRGNLKKFAEIRRKFSENRTEIRTKIRKNGTEIQRKLTEICRNLEIRNSLSFFRSQHLNSSILIRSCSRRFVRKPVTFRNPKFTVRL